MSLRHYAGGGRFAYELDVLNMAEVGEVIAAAGWRPAAGFVMPPEHPDRNPASGG